VRRILKAGEGYTTPNEGAVCVLKIKGQEASSGRVFDERDEVTFEVGECIQSKIPEGVEHALLKFELGECSQLRLKPAQVFGGKGCADLGLPAGVECVYEVELKSF